MTTQTQLENAFDIKTKKLNYKLLVQEVLNSSTQELEHMFFAQYPYSITNRVLAATQCHKQGFKFGLLQCVSKWTEQNRTQKANAHKLWLRMPCTYIKRDKYTKQPILNENGDKQYGQCYKFANNWLVYDQTEGQELDTKELNTIFNLQKTLDNLLIKVVEFDDNGAAGGYAIVNKRELAVNPAWHNTKTVAKVFFHELAHIVLDHNQEQLTEQKELEAELTAMMIAKIFNLDCKEQAAYIKDWLNGNLTLFNQDTYKKCLQACETIVRASKSDKPIIEYKDNKYQLIK